MLLGATIFIFAVDNDAINIVGSNFHAKNAIVFLLLAEDFSTSAIDPHHPPQPVHPPVAIPIQNGKKILKYFLYLTIIFYAYDVYK